MVNRPFLSRRMMETTIPRLDARALETDLGIFGREVTFDRDGEPIGPMLVVVEWPNREADASAGATNIVTADGELHGRPGEMDTVRADDLFAIDGQTAEVVEPIITDKGVVRAPFRLMAGRRD